MPPRGTFRVVSAAGSAGWCGGRALVRSDAHRNSRPPTLWRVGNMDMVGKHVALSRHRTVTVTTLILFFPLSLVPLPPARVCDSRRVCTHSRFP